MQRIPGEILDAVRMETESEWVKITKDVWPLVAPSATIVFTLLFVGAFNWFELPYIMAGSMDRPTAPPTYWGSISTAPLSAMCRLASRISASAPRWPSSFSSS
jgi:ABC-type sugar transport system permease subunit